MANWWDAAPRADDAPRESGNWWEAAPIAEEAPREFTNYRGLRIAKTGSKVEVNPEPTDEERAALYDQAETVGTGALAFAGGMGAGPAIGAVGKVLTSPVGGALLAGGSTLYHTGDPVAAAMAAGGAFGAQKYVGKFLDVAGGAVAKSVMARLEHQLGQAAKSAPKVVEEVAERAYRGIPGEMNIGRAAPAVAQRPVAEAASKVASIAERQAVAEAAPVARKLAPIPPGQSRIPSVLTKPPTQGPKMPNPAQEALKAKQLEAAKAAGMDLGEAFGGKPAPIAEQAAESALETRLRASVMLHKDKPALAAEIGSRVLEMRAAGGRAATAEKISQAIEEQYGLPPTNVRQMVQMILREASR